MNKQNELIVGYNRKNFRNGFFLLLLFTIFIMFFSLFLTSIVKTIFNNNFLGFLITILIKFIFGFLTATFIFALIHLILLIKSETPLAILNNKGIWINHYGFINWNTILIMEFSAMPGGNNSSTISLKINDISQLSKQTDWYGWVELSWARFFGQWFSIYRYHLSIFDAGTVSTQEIMLFAKPYLKQETRL